MELVSHSFYGSAFGPCPAITFCILPLSRSAPNLFRPQFRFATLRLPVRSAPGALCMCKSNNSSPTVTPLAQIQRNEALTVGCEWAGQRLGLGLWLQLQESSGNCLADFSRKGQIWGIMCKHASARNGARNGLVPIGPLSWLRVRVHRSSSVPRLPSVSVSVSASPAWMCVRISRFGDLFCTSFNFRQISYYNFPSQSCHCAFCHCIRHLGELRLGWAGLGSHPHLALL